MVGASSLVGLLESVSACLADLVAFAGVFVVGGDIPDAFVEPHRVVVAADAFEFSGEVGGVVERFEVGVFAFDVAEQGLDPGLVGGRGPASEVLGDRAHGHEFGGVAGAHLRSVVADRQQQRDCVAVGQVCVGVVEAGGEFVGEEPFALQCFGEQDSGGDRVRCRGVVRGDPFTGHHIDYRVGVLGLSACRELGAVPTPQLVGPPLTPGRPRRLGGLGRARRAGQSEAVTCENAVHSRSRHPHAAQVGAAVRELAMRPVGVAPLVEEAHDLVTF